MVLSLRRTESRPVSLSGASFVTGPVLTVMVPVKTVFGSTPGWVTFNVQVLPTAPR